MEARRPQQGKFGTCDAARRDTWLVRSVRMAGQVAGWLADKDQARGFVDVDWEEFSSDRFAMSARGGGHK